MHTLHEETSSAKLLNGRQLSKIIKEELAQKVARIAEAGERVPHLAAVLVGDDAASASYVRNKVRACARCGFQSTLIKKPADISQEELLQIIKDLNENEEIDGFIVQLPLPKHIDEAKVTMAIDPRKDVDGFHPVNVGRMTLNMDAYLPATPYGILQLLDRYHIEVEGKECVVLGRSNIVGTPISILLSRKASPGNATITLCHSRTHHLKEHCQRADIIIAALGIPGFLTADMVKEGAVVIDVGINRVDDPLAKMGYRLVGDVKFDEVAPKCSYITPVPGGVGPMTVTALLLNTYRANRKEVYG